MTSARIEVPGFTIEEELGAGASSVVYRAARNGQAFAIKVLKAVDGQRLAHAGLRFRREAGVLARIRHPSVVRVLEVGEVQERPYLVMELVQGETLAAQLARGPLPQPRVAELGAALARALAEIHRKGIVHRDIKPTNVIVQPGGVPRIIDFEFVTGPADEAQQKGEVAGTLLYAAPEQMGVLKLPVDGRSDLYALGVVLFECLSGRPPFVESTASALIHRHATQAAPDVRQYAPSVSAAMAAVVARLLAKDPDDRYQSGAGVAQDLQMLGSLDADARAGRAIALGRADVRTRAVHQTPVTGREKELERLGLFWSKAAGGTGTAALVEGESGSGKTRIAHELATSARADRAIVLSARCQQNERSPFGPLREALDRLVSDALRLPETERDAALSPFIAAVGELAPLLQAFSPGVALALKNAGKIHGPAPATTPELLYTALTEVLVGMGQKGQPLLFVLDDFQWVDDASLRVLGNVRRRLPTTRVMLLLLARNEAAHTAALERVLAPLNPLDGRVALGPLDGGAIGRVIAAQLGGQEIDQAIVSLISARTHGNPLAIHEHVQALIDHGALRPVDGTWQVDRKAFDELELPTDTLGLMVSRMDALSAGTREVLTVAAVVGGAFRLQHLGALPMLAGKPVQEALGEAAGFGLVEPVGGDTWRFAHERVREALVANLAEGTARDIHQAVAELLDAAEGPRDAFALAWHYTRGHVERRPRRVFETTRDAGVKALEAFSNEQAYELLTQAAQRAATLEGTVEGLGALEDALGQACTRTARIPEAIAHFDKALQLTTEPPARVRIHINRARLQMALWNPKGVWDECRNALAALGEPWTDDGSTTDTRVMRLALAAHRLDLDKPVTLTPEQTPRRVALASIYGLAAFMAWAAGNTRLCLGLLARVRSSLEALGRRKEIIEPLQIYGCLMGALGLKEHIDHAAAEVEPLAEKTGDKALHAAACRNLSFGYHSYGDYRRSEHFGRMAIHKLGKWLLPRDFVAGINDLATNCLTRGYLQEALDLEKQNVELADRLRLVTAGTSSRAALAAAEAAMGLMADAATHMKEAQETTKRFAPDDIWNIGWVLSYAVFVRLEQDDLGPRVEEDIAAFRKLGTTLLDVPYPQRPFYVHTGWVRLRQWLTAPDGERRDAAAASLGAALRELRVVARDAFCRASLYAMLATIARVRGKRAQAARMLGRCEHFSTAMDGLWTAMEAACERARLARDDGDTAAMKTHAQNALGLALKQGWKRRIRAIKDEFGVTEAAVAGVSTSTWGSTVVGSTTHRASSSAVAGRQLEALLKVSRATAGTLDPVEQARTAMDEVIALLGAERAFCFACDGTTGPLTLLTGRDNKRAELPQATAYSTTVVEKVRATRAPLVVAGTEEGILLGSESAVTHDLRSIIAVPLLFQDALRGVIYLDSRLAKHLFTDDDTALLGAMASIIAVAAENARMAREEVERQTKARELEREMELTAAVNTYFLPPQRRFSTGKLEVEGYWRPAAKCSGDWWWYQESGGGRALVVIGDVTGHGVASAMVTASVGLGFRMLQRAGGTLPEKLRALHEEMQHLCKGRFLMTLTALDIDVATGHADIWNLGGPSMLRVDRSGALTAVGAAGTPLGSQSFELGHAVTTVEPGTRLLMYTDGITEFETDGRQLGTRRLGKLLQSTASHPAERAGTALGALLDEHCQRGQQTDDMTFVLVCGRDA